MPESETRPWTVYIIMASDGSYYTGITTDLDRRFTEHGQGKKGAKFFRGRTPREVVYTETDHSHSSALIREAAIKKLNRAQKEQLVDHSVP